MLKNGKIFSATKGGATHGPDDADQIGNGLRAADCRHGVRGKGRPDADLRHGANTGHYGSDEDASDFAKG